MTKMEQVVDEAAARFDERPLHRASIEARAELMGKVKIDLADPETRAVWEIAQAAKREVASWPTWKTGAVAVGEAVEELRAALAERDHLSTRLAQAEKERDGMVRVVSLARRVVSRGIHRRQDHREVMLRNVELLPNDIEGLAMLAEAVEGKPVARNCQSPAVMSDESKAAIEDIIGAAGQQMRTREERDFEDDWDQVKRGSVPVARCKRCGFECFVGADATIEEHDKTHALSTASGRGDRDA